MQLRYRIILANAILVLTFLSTSCGAGTPAITTQEINETVSTVTITPIPTETIPAPATPEKPTEPADPTQVILLSPPDVDPNFASSLESILSELASSEGLKFERLASLDADQLNPNTRLVVGLAPDPGLAALAASAPQVQFLGIDIPDLAAGANISTISAQSSSSVQLGFLAGYLAAMVTPEWRVGVLAPNDTPAGVAARQGFGNGVVFFCGLCRQTYPPYVTYPLFAELPSSASPAEWQTAAKALVDQSVKTIYLAPGADSDELSAFLAEAGVNLIGSRPPPAGIGERWIATLQADPTAAIREIWPSLLAGNEGNSFSVPLSVSHVNEDILTPGRMRLLEDMLKNLEEGYITPATP